MNSPSAKSNTHAGEKENQQSKNDSFPVVGIGASAGGLEAFTQLLRALPDETGAGFVLIQHLDPTHHSILTELLSKATGMPVSEAKEDMEVEPNHVYVIPPNQNMAISDGTLKLTPRTETRGQSMPIDHFLRSLAEDQGSTSIGVILSGTGSDGTLGLAAIKAEGGITFAQEEKSAKYDGMPRSAIAAGCVDSVLPPEGIATELARIGSHPYVTKPTTVEELVPEGEVGLRNIFALVRNATGVDFTDYRRTTINRRIARRMLLHKVDKTEDYVRLLSGNPAEVRALYHDMLINVTSFFRNPESFEVLKRIIFPDIMKDRSPQMPIRIWAPGCSSGEETYSLAISLLEFLGDNITGTSIQLFGTDLSEVGVEKARAGIYPENIQADVTPERLRRFFVKTENGYQIGKTIRDMCVFARQNIFMDPPFSQLDLISCRNLLIYLEPVLQRNIFPIFHYALKPNGFLMLGASEGISTFGHLFATVEKKHKLYAKKKTAARPHLEFPVGSFARKDTNRGIGKGASAVSERGQTAMEVQKEADGVVLSEYAPAGVVINDDLEVLQFRGKTGAYLEPAPGSASLALLKMARPGLLFDLRTSIDKAKKENVPVTREGVQITSEDQVRNITLKVIPLKSSHLRERNFLVLFEERAGRKPVKTEGVAAGKSEQEGEIPQVTLLKKELAATKEYLQSLVETEQAANEELQSANEEILSSNEELQSTNEELETAKEELQSTNEELNTVNEELRSRNLELGQSRDYAQALNARLNLAQQAARLASWEWFPDTGEIKWSDNAASICGFGSKSFDVNYENWLQLVHPEDRERVTSARARAVQERSEYDIEFRVVSPDGSTRWLAGRGKIYAGEPGKPLRMVGIHIDITGAKMAEAALRSSEKLAAAGRLAAILGHEISNPLESLTGVMYLLSQNSTLDPPVREYVALAQEELRRIAHISKQSLELHRESPAPVRVRVSEIIESILSLSATKIHECGVNIEKRYEFDGEILGFPGELRQVFINLIINAIEASDAGGTVKIHVFDSRDWRDSERQGVRIVIADEGSGIPAEHRGKVFQPFFSTKGQKGTGVGLWVTQDVIQKHNGSIHVRSSVSPRYRGTCFSVFLPSEGGRPAKLRTIPAA
jgi:two-component system CheB/CheR fusion protein